MVSALRVGIVGLGFGARVHLPAFQSIPRVEVVAVTDPEGGKAEQVAANMGVPRAFTHWQDMVALPDLDVISVATPPAFQAEVVVAALSAGKHVLCEKPFGLNLADAQAMWKAAQASGRHHAVDFEFRMEPGIAALKRQVQAGAVGTVRRIDVTWLTGGRADPALPWSWQHDADLGGGVLQAFGSHVADYVEWISQSQIGSVWAQANVLIGTRKDSNGHEREVTAEDSCDLLCVLSTGAIANLRFSNCYPFGAGHRIEVYGDRGRIIYTHEPPFTPDRASVCIETDATGLHPVQGETPPDMLAPDSRIPLFQQIARRFVEAIFGHSDKDLPDFTSGLRVRAVLQAAQDSLNSRRQTGVLGIPY